MELHFGILCFADATQKDKISYDAQHELIDIEAGIKNQTYSKDIFSRRNHSLLQI